MPGIDIASIARASGAVVALIAAYIAAFLSRHNRPGRTFEHSVSDRALRASSPAVLAPLLECKRNGRAAALRTALQGLGTRSTDLLGLKDWRGLSPDFSDDSPQGNDDWTGDTLDWRHTRLATQRNPDMA